MLRKSAKVCESETPYEDLGFETRLGSQAHSDSLFRTPVKRESSHFKSSTGLKTQASSNPSSVEKSSLRFVDHKFSKVIDSSIFKKKDSCVSQNDSQLNNDSSINSSRDDPYTATPKLQNEVHLKRLMTPQHKSSRVFTTSVNSQKKLLFDSSSKINYKFETEVLQHVENNLDTKHQNKTNFRQIPVIEIQTVGIPQEVIHENVIERQNIVDINESQLGYYPQYDRLPTESHYIHRKYITERPILVENIIEKDVYIPREKIIENPIEKIVEKKVSKITNRPVPVEKQIFKEVDVMVENPVYRHIDIVVEKPVYIDNIIELPVPVEKVIEREVEVPIETVIEKPILIEKPLQVFVEQIVEIPKPIEKIQEISSDQFYLDKIPVDEVKVVEFEKVISIPRFEIQTKNIEVMRTKEVVKAENVDHFIEKNSARIHEKRVEHIIERPVYIERITQKPIIKEKIIEVPVEVIIERIIPITKIVEREVVYESIVEKLVEQIVIKDVEVFVEKEVPVEVVIEIPNIIENVIEVFEDVQVEIKQENPISEDEVEEFEEEFDDEVISQAIERCKKEIGDVTEENNSLRNQRNILELELAELKSCLLSADNQINQELQIKLEDLKAKLKEESFDFSLKNSKSNKPIVETVVKRNPRYDELRRILFELSKENSMLIKKARQMSERLSNFC